MKYDFQTEDVTILFENVVFHRVRSFRNMGFHGGIPCNMSVNLDKTILLKNLIFLIFQSPAFIQTAISHITEKNDSARIMLFSNINALNLSSLDNLNQKAETVIGWNCFEDPHPDDIAYIIRHAFDPPMFMLQVPFPWKRRIDPKIPSTDGTDLSLLLTDRELEVLVLLTEGASNHRIAEVLCISENTAKTHVRRILEKLQINNRTKAALFAIEAGLCSQKPNKIVLLQEDD